MMGLIACTIALFLCSMANAMELTTFYHLALKQKGINAFGATAQSILETGHWTSTLWVQANNGAGIKATPKWRKDNPYISVCSSESVNGKYIQRVSYFRKYPTADEFLDDYSSKIRNDYPHCKADNVWGYFAGLYRGRYGKWATDHRYYEKLARQAVYLEPLLLREGHLKGALDYAIKMNYLEQWQIDIIKAVVK